MNRKRRLFDTERIDADHGDRAEQRDPGPVKLHEWQPAQDHADVDDDKQSDDRGCHSAVDASFIMASA